MAFERQRTVKDGENVVNENNNTGADPTKGTLSHGVDTAGKARPFLVEDEELQTSDQNTIDLLSAICDELKEIKMYLKLIAE